QEVRVRGKACVERITRECNSGLLFTIVRLLEGRRPPGAADALLRYLPYAADEELEEEIWYALYDLVKCDAKALTLLRTGLADGLPARRSVAACILGRLGAVEDKAAVRNLLTDCDASVRLRAAQGLLIAHDKAGIPPLIGL